MKLLAGIGKIFNGVKFEFPLEECISSVLMGADEFVLTVCDDSEDNTVEFCEQLAVKFNGKLRLLHDKWRLSPTENYTNMVRLANKSIEAANSEWIWSVDMDEVPPPNEPEKLRKLLSSIGDNVGCIMLNFNHLYYDLDHKILGKLYPKIHRVGRKGLNWRSGHDGCGLGGGQGTVYDSDVIVNHYGYLREWKTMIEKESRFQSELYHEGVPGLPDQRLIEFSKKSPESKQAFYNAFVSPNDNVIAYDGPPHHPGVIKRWR